MNNLRNSVYLALLALPIVLLAPKSHAAIVASEPITYKFDFNDIARPLSTTDASLRGYGLGNIGLSSSVSLAMTTALKTVAPTSTVTAVGAVATQNYNGEGRVATTLGNSDSGVMNLKLDTFLVNNNFRAVQTNSTTAKAGTVSNPDRFTLNFGNFTVTGVQFDYEIFPDFACRMGTGCGPDMTLLAGSQSVWHMTTTPSTKSDPQALGTTQKIAFNGVSSLSFVDWPSEIGIDNLIITGCVTAVNGRCGSTQVPEPASIALLGVGIAGLAASRRRRKAKGMDLRTAK